MKKTSKTFAGSFGKGERKGRNAAPKFQDPTSTLTIQKQEGATHCGAGKMINTTRPKSLRFAQWTLAFIFEDQD